MHSINTHNRPAIRLWQTGYCQLISMGLVILTILVVMPVLVRILKFFMEQNEEKTI